MITQLSLLASAAVPQIFFPQKPAMSKESTT